MVDATQQNGLVGSRTSIGRKPMAVNFSQLQANLLQVSNPGPPSDGKNAAEIELVSLTGDREETFNKAELTFINWLDAEIKKIDDFYTGKEKIAAVRYKRISAQLEALRQLQDNDSKSSQDFSPMEPSSSEDTSGFRSACQSLIHKLHVSFDRLSSSMPAADHEDRAGQPEYRARPITTKTGYVEYHVARRRLKHAILEYYRSMELLKEYRLLNRTALEKILKKFDKRCGRRVSGEWVEKVKAMHFEQSDELENLISHTEV
jgi:xenotropic and polytropic retrovirus receptor 1